ncbi:MAG TPA: hypothetical protein VMD59_20610, partial [Acidimicrobiales bacterium]|nr:hypothetical protein [Acidimicrobiales bacterium]
FGLDPSSAPARRAVALIGANSRWDHAGEAYWEGEVEECINGRLVADGAYFGVDVAPIASRLAGERLADGGWNCERANGSVRRADLRAPARTCSTCGVGSAPCASVRAATLPAIDSLPGCTDLSMRSTGCSTPTPRSAGR